MYPNPYYPYRTGFVDPYYPLYNYAPENYGYPYFPTDQNEERINLPDHGKMPFTIDIEEATENNRAFRRAIWTGEYLQVTLMSIPVGEDIGLEAHPTTDQFLRIEQGEGIVRMGNQQDHLDFNVRVSEDDAIMVPAGKWHNLINTGDEPLKLYSIYAPPEHPFGTVHRTKAEAEIAEGH